MAGEQKPTEKVRWMADRFKVQQTTGRNRLVYSRLRELRGRQLVRRQLSLNFRRRG